MEYYLKEGRQHFLYVTVSKARQLLWQYVREVTLCYWCVTLSFLSGEKTQLLRVLKGR